MAQVCVSRNLNIDGNELTAAPWSVPRVVLDRTFNSTGDGPFGQQTTAPGKLMIDSGVLSWTSDSPLPTTILIRVQRAYRTYVTSSPNVVQIRDRWTTSIGGTTPRVPDTSSIYQGATGGGVDMSTDRSTRPNAGKIFVWEDACMTEDMFGPVPPGKAFKLRYRCNLWTPPPWSNNANENNPQHEAYVRSTRIQMIALPLRDEAVTR